jgi:predicted glycoside hydrolase/deacetylase ChbG (UPF0249 family)
MKFILHADDFGRSPVISKNIIQCIDKGKIQQTSVMMGFVNVKIHKILSKKKIKKRLHLNLTENKYLDNKKKDFTFFGLFFLRKKFKEIIFKEINNQIYEYCKIYGAKNIRLDSHQHVHMIPWIYKYIYNCKLYKISEIRYSVENLLYFNIKVLFNIKFYRNILAWFIIKLCSYKNKKKSKYFFQGLILSDMYDEELLKKSIKKAKENTEILLHPGFTNYKERKMFNKIFFKYYNSKQRYLEKKILFNL